MQKNKPPDIWDPIRKKWLKFTPEEWVRQQTIAWLHHIQKVPLGLISIEAGLHVRNLKKRTDIVVYKQTKPHWLIECKSFSLTLSQNHFSQLAIYNTTIQAPYIVLTNGLKMQAWVKVEHGYDVIVTLPPYTE